MNDETTPLKATPGQAAQIEEISNLRKDIAKILVRIEDMLTRRPIFGAELTLSKRALQTARHWLGECLAFLPTGYRVTDNPNDPGSESKAV